MSEADKMTPCCYCNKEMTANGGHKCKMCNSVVHGTEDCSRPVFFEGYGKPTICLGCYYKGKLFRMIITEVYA